MSKSTPLTREIDRLKMQLLLLGGKVEERYRQSVLSLKEQDSELAQTVIDGDQEIDAMEVELEEECLKILALHQPVASDLRFIITVLKVNNDLERIGDLAVNIAEVTCYLFEHSMAIPYDFTQMAKKTGEMFRDSLNALVDQNSALANQVRADDDEVDAINDEVFGFVEKSIKKQPNRTGCFMKTLSVSKRLERIADLSTNIAEDVVYLVDGAIVRH